MKAVIYTKYGPPEVLHLAEVDKPAPRDNEVLIRVRATTVSVADFRCRSFTVPLSFWIPARLALGVRRPRRRILGSECAGEVEQTGKDVTRFKKGDQVFAGAIMGPGALRRVHLPCRDRRDRAEAGQHDLRGGRGRADRSPRRPPLPQEGEHHGRPEGPRVRSVGQRRHLRRATRQVVRRGGHRRVQRLESRTGEVAWRRRRRSTTRRRTSPPRARSTTSSSWRWTRAPSPTA